MKTLFHTTTRDLYFVLNTLELLHKHNPSSMSDGDEAVFYYLSNHVFDFPPASLDIDVTVHDPFTLTLDHYSYLEYAVSVELPLIYQELDTVYTIQS